jgi:autoinducer 2-degrading protein
MLNRKRRGVLVTASPAKAAPLAAAAARTTRLNKEGHFMLAIIVDFEAEPGQGAELCDALKTQARNSLENEEGCRHFDVCADPDNDHRFMLYELYDDEAAIEAHRSTDYYAAFRERINPIVKNRNLRLWPRL